MIVLDDDAYEWHETTTMEDQARGRRTFVRGRPKDEATRLRDEMNKIVLTLDGSSSEVAREIREQIRRLLR